MTDDMDNDGSIEIGDLSEDDIGHILTIIATDGYYNKLRCKVSAQHGREFWVLKDTPVDL